MSDVTHRTNLDPYGKLDVGSLFGRTFSSYFRNFFPLTGITLLVSLPTSIWTIVMLSDVTITDMLAGSDAMTAYSWGSMLLALVLQPIATAAVVFAVFRFVKSGTLASIGHSLRVGLVRLPTLIAVALIVGLMLVGLALPGAALAFGMGGFGVFLAVVLLVPVAFVLYVGLFVTVPAVVVERAGALESLRRSWDLTAGQRWRIFGFLMLFVLIYMGFAIVLVAFSFMGGAMRDPLLLYRVQLVASLASGPVFSALNSVATTLTYFDLKVLKEGVGVEELESIFE